jgi:hypothetical protein
MKPFRLKEVSFNETCSEGRTVQHLSDVYTSNFCLKQVDVSALRASFDSDIDCRDPPPPFPSRNPRSGIFLLNPKFPSFSKAITLDLSGIARLQVTAPYTLVLSHNNSSHSSNLLSLVYIFSSSWYGPISIKFLSLHYLAQFPYLSHS